MKRAALTVGLAVLIFVAPFSGSAQQADPTVEGQLRNEVPKEHQRVYLTGTHQTPCAPSASVDCPSFFKKWAQDACGILNFKGGSPTKIEFTPPGGFKLTEVACELP
jgi:hypothetical protein